MRRRTTWTLLFLLLVSPLAARASGRIELNQASVEASGGFPVVVRAPGNYVLTGPLQVPPDTDGFVLETSDVVFDLAGFAIRGGHSCSIGACAAGSGSGFRPGLSVAFARRVTLRNGLVAGFGGDCISLNSGALVSELVVRECGGVGIGAASGSLVESNRVSQTGGAGLRLSGSTLAPLYSGNAVSNAGLAGGGEPTVDGGHAGAANTCDDGACARRGQRRFYLTSTSFPGSQAASACDSGFRVAALWEMYDPSSLDYDFRRGLDITGGVFPDTRIGWGFDGVNDCFDYAGGGTGIALQLLNPVQVDPPWTTYGRSCDMSFRVWCIEE